MAWPSGQVRPPKQLCHDCQMVARGRPGRRSISCLAIVVAIAGCGHSVVVADQGVREGDAPAATSAAQDEPQPAAGSGDRQPEPPPSSVEWDKVAVVRAWIAERPNERTACIMPDGSMREIILNLKDNPSATAPAAVPPMPVAEGCRPLP